jgi:uncharacterized membrane protein YgaE (UPF0421/DUF939 family)
MSYSLNRILDTAVGVVVSILINYWSPRERVVHVLTKIGLRKHDD